MSRPPLPDKIGMSVDLPLSLPEYFPFAAGRYEVKPGLFRFSKSLGGGDADKHVFQFDHTFPRYRAAKLANRAERLGKYFCTDRLSPAVAERAARFISERLTREHPSLFGRADNTLNCSLTGERLVLGDSFDLKRVEGPSAVHPPYVSTIDALAMQVQEDLAIIRVEDQRDWLSAIHLSFPNFWAAEEKIGKAFPMVHQPVAGMEQMNRQSEHLIQVMLTAADGLVRFAWGITWDDVLNHHPEPPADEMKRFNTFDPDRPCAFLRVERQTIWGFPELSFALFTIRTYFYNVAEFRRDPERRSQLYSAIESMSESSLGYKRLDVSRAELLKWLRPDNQS
jgi:hypothetical protein